MQKKLNDYLLKPAIRLRKIQESDLMQIAAWRMSPEVTKFMYTDPVLTMEDQVKWLERIREDDKCEHWIINCDNVSIGMLGVENIDKKNNRCTWSLYIGESNYKGLGIAKILELNIFEYVFNTIGINKLYSEVLSFNTATIELHKKCGQEIEGILKKHVYKNDQYLDVVMMGITRKHWEEIKENYEYDRIEFEE